MTFQSLSSKSTPKKLLTERHWVSLPAVFPLTGWLALRYWGRVGSAVRASVSSVPARLFAEAT